MILAYSFIFASWRIAFCLTCGHFGNVGLFSYSLDRFCKRKGGVRLVHCCSCLMNKKKMNCLKEVSDNVITNKLHDYYYDCCIQCSLPYYATVQLHCLRPCPLPLSTRPRRPTNPPRSSLLFCVLQEVG